MEENGKKWKRSVVDVQIERIWYDLVLIVENFILIDLVLIVGMIVGMFFIFIVETDSDHPLNITLTILINCQIWGVDDLVEKFFKVCEFIWNCQEILLYLLCR